MSEIAKQAIERLKGQLQTELSELVKLADSVVGDQEAVQLDQQRLGRLSRVDALQGQAMAIASGSRRAIRIKKLNAALVRIDEGEYGYCAGCDELIAIKRLQADPAALLCLSCASAGQGQAR